MRKAFAIVLLLLLCVSMPLFSSVWDIIDFGITVADSVQREMAAREAEEESLKSGEIVSVKGSINSAALLGGVGNAAFQLFDNDSSPVALGIGGGFNFSGISGYERGKDFSIGIGYSAPVSFVIDARGFAEESLTMAFIAEGEAGLGMRIGKGSNTFNIIFPTAGLYVGLVLPLQLQFGVSTGFDMFYAFRPKTIGLTVGLRGSVGIGLGFGGAGASLESLGFGMSLYWNAMAYVGMAF